MASYTIEDIELIRRKSGISYQEAVSLLDYHNGKEKAIGFLVGQTMKAMKGKADPASVNQMLKELL